MIIMDMESIELTINQLNGQIEQAQMEINRLQAEIEDTELSQENAKSLRTDFDRFIEISRQNSRPVSSMLLRSV